MKRAEWNEGLNHIDTDIIENYVEQKDKYISISKRKRTWLKIGALAACFCLIASIIVIPTAFKTEDPLYHPFNSDSNFILPSISVISTGTEINGKTHIVSGDNDTDNGSASKIPEGFYVHTVVQANVIEVLQDLYYTPSRGAAGKYRIARLEIVDPIIGEKMPREINLRFSGYSADIFEKHDTFIFSLNQIGIENYMMINDTKNEVEYFPDMFEVEIDILRYGSVIPFKDGKVDYSFGGSWSFPSNLSPLSGEYTIENVKKRIIDLSQNKEDYFVHLSTSPDYVTIDDVFSAEECKQIKNCILPTESNIFMHNIAVHSNRVVVNYTRVINGFETDEKIVVTVYSKDKGNVTREGEAYTPEELSRMPNIGEVLENINLDEIRSPRIDNLDGIKHKRVSADGCYRKREGKVYGIVRIIWWCDFSTVYSVGYEQDARYYLYDAEGNGKIVKGEKLEELFGGHWLIP